MSSIGATASESQASRLPFELVVKLEARYVHECMHVCVCMRARRLACSALRLVHSAVPCHGDPHTSLITPLPVSHPHSQIQVPSYLDTHARTCVLV
jgi:hypothetical protein